MDSVLELDRCAGASERYPPNVNPQWVRLLDLLQMNVRYERCRGTELFVTFSENSLAMRAALATPGSFGEEELAKVRLKQANICRHGWLRRSETLPWSRRCGGVGLLMGIEFQPPRQLHLRVPSRICGGASRHVRADRGDAACFAIPDF